MWLIGSKRPIARKVDWRKRRFLNCEGDAARQNAARKKLNKSIDGLKFDETFLTERSVKFRHRFVKFQRRSVKFRHVDIFQKLVVDSGGGRCYNPRHSKHGSRAASGAGPSKSKREKR